MALIDMINAHVSKGYELNKIWYEPKWLYPLYYAKVALRTKEKLEFIIGPISTKELPKPPKLDLIIGPIANKN